MKQMFCMLLVGALTFPLIGCNASAVTGNGKSITPPQPVNEDSADTPQDTVSTRIADTYRISIDAEEQQVYQLSEAIDVIPVQPRPATESLKDDFNAYLCSLQNIRDKLGTYSAQVEQDLSDGHLSHEDYDAIVFQLDQLSSRIQSLTDTLCVVYGISDNAA